jgi:hypothetical protein
MTAAEFKKKWSRYNQIKSESRKRQKMMKKSKLCSVIAGLGAMALFVLTSNTGQAQISYNSFWNASAGNTPDLANPPWTLDTNTGSSYSLPAGGPLTLTAPANFQSILYYQLATNLAIPSVLEIQATVRVLSSQSSVNYRAGTAIIFQNSNSIGNVLFLGNGNIFLLSPSDPSGDTLGPSTAVDTEGAFHTYRIEVNGTEAAGGAVAVFYDGGPVLTGTTFQNINTLAGIAFVEGGVSANGSAAWQSFEHNAGSAPPALSIQHATNGVTLLWPASTTIYRLQQNADLTTNWVPNMNATNLVNGTNQVTISPAFGKMFFQLIYP